MPMPCEREDPCRDYSDEVQSVRCACDAGPESNDIQFCMRMVTSYAVLLDVPFAIRLFYGCSYMFHLSGDNSRDRHIKGS